MPALSTGTTVITVDEKAKFDLLVSVRERTVNFSYPYNDGAYSYNPTGIPWRHQLDVNDPAGLYGMTAHDKTGGVIRLGVAVFPGASNVDGGCGKSCDVDGYVVHQTADLKIEAFGHMNICRQ